MAEVEKVFHIRHSQHNDEGIVPSPDTHPTMSPDIICYQNAVLTYDDAVKSYSKYICKHFIQNQVNFVYVRAKNHTGVAQNGEVEAFYSPYSLLHIPENWRPLYTATGKPVLELRQARHELAEPDAIVLSSEAFVLQAVMGDVKNHYCMMAVSRRKGEEWLALPQKFNGDKDLWNFLRNHANIAYNNIVVENGFNNQYTEVIQVANHNSYDEEYAIRLTLGKGETFGKCNLGRIQLLCSEIDSPFDLHIRPEKDSNVAVSPSFRLPAGYNKHIIVTYFADDSKKRVTCTITHDYITCNSKGLIPVKNDIGKQLKTVNRLGNEIFINEDAKIGDCVLVFSDENEPGDNFLKK